MHWWGKSDKIKSEETKVAGIVKNIFKMSVVALAIPAVALGAQRVNPRAGGVRTNQAPDNSATSVISRSVAKDGRQTRSAVNASSIKSRSARSATAGGTPNAARNTRSAVVPEKQTAKSGSRVQTARATAVFNDVSKIGGGFASCRDAYATCMDQFCANANDTYRRCYCSDKFTRYRETSENLDTALGMLADFQNENLDAVDKTAAEVTAMYMASEGEKAIKKDTSASQKLLNNISNILSGKSTVKTNTNLNSLGVLDFSDFEFDEGDIWGESSSIFGGDSASNIADLEGKALYNKVNKQCVEIVKDACGSDAVFNLARSSYSIMISQDCNVIEKNINAKRAAVEETVRTAQKYLRDARLDEYRAHNSADVLECLGKVETAMRNPLACGENYERCMDYTGKYISYDTGEAIYSKELFGLNSLIILDGSADVLKANSEYDKWLDKNTKKFAETALDSCRDISNVVWQEFKRSALIQMAQAQDDRIQKIKDSCVETIKECYDEKSESLYDMDTTDMQSTGAVVAVAARGTCYDKVLACAALYGDQDGCKFDDKSKKLTNAPGKKCGLQSLLAFVDTVDAVKVAEGCEIALTKYAHQLCDPQVGDDTVVYPAGCASMSREELWASMEARRKTFCPATMVNNDDANTLSTSADAYNTTIMNQVIQDIYRELDIVFTAGCDEFDGTWTTSVPASSDLLNADFYLTYYGITINSQTNVNSLNSHQMGWCIGGTRQQQCVALGSQYASWNGTDCILTAQGNQHLCENNLGGNWSLVNEQCAITDIFDVFTH